jgi:hypothetical protein
MAPTILTRAKGIGGRKLRAVELLICPIECEYYLRQLPLMQKTNTYYPNHIGGICGAIALLDIGEIVREIGPRLRSCMEAADNL